jgi:hypothetical protein
MQGANDSNCFKKKRNQKRSGGGSNAIPTAPLTTGRGGGKRGNAWRRDGSGRRQATSRFKLDAISPLLLPHVKVTLRNIGDVAKHQTIENIITSVRKFLVGAFPSSHLDGTVESDAYTMTLVLERDEFDAAKSIFAEAMSVNSASGDGSMGTANASAFSYGWIHQDKPAELSSDRASLPLHTNDIVTNFMASIADSNVTDSSNINWVVDTAMSQMMQQCGKQYLNFVGGRVILDEISSGGLILAERVKRERKELAGGTKVHTSKGSEEIGPCEPADEQTRITADDFFVNMEESNSVGTLNNYLPAVCVRILSVTPVKKSKRRGDIGGEVQLTLHPPDPCLLFKEVCRDAGKLALEKIISMKCCAVPGGEEHATDAEIFDFSNMSSANKVHPQVPYYPLLSPSERSRAVTRSLVLVNRIIQTMKFHAASLKRDESHSFWEVTESLSQKTWKGRNISGKALRGAHPVCGVTPDRDFRFDRFDSTIENSNDYKAYVESLNDGSVLPVEKVVTGSKSWVSKAVDDEGRPLSAIVVYMRAKHAEIDRVKTETVDAREKAVAAKEKTRKDKVKSKREPLRKLKKEAVQTKKQASAMSSSRSVGSSGSGVAKR